MSNQHRDDRDFGDGSDYPRFEPLAVPQLLNLQTYAGEYAHVDINLDDLADSKDQLLDIEDFILLSGPEEVNINEVIAITEKPTKPITKAALENALVRSTLHIGTPGV